MDDQRLRAVATALIDIDRAGQLPALTAILTAERRRHRQAERQGATIEAALIARWMSAHLGLPYRTALGAVDAATERSLPDVLADTIIGYAHDLAIEAAYRRAAS